jgi:hypothetical protein
MLARCVLAIVLGAGFPLWVNGAEPPASAEIPTTGDPTADAAKKAAEEAQKRIERVWDWMLKLNRDGKELMQLWAPEKATIKGLIDDLKTLHEMVDGLPEGNAREPFPAPWKDKASDRFGDLRGVLSTPKNSPTTAPGQEAEKKGDTPSAATLLRKRAKASPPVQLIEPKCTKDTN